MGLPWPFSAVRGQGLQRCKRSEVGPGPKFFRSLPRRREQSAASHTQPRVAGCLPGLRGHAAATVAEGRGRAQAWGRGATGMNARHGPRGAAHGTGGSRRCLHGRRGGSPGGRAGAGDSRVRAVQAPGAGRVTVVVRYSLSTSAGSPAEGLPGTGSGRRRRRRGHRPHVRPQSRARGEVLIPGDIAGMVLGQTDRPLLDGQLDVLTWTCPPGARR